MPASAGGSSSNFTSLFIGIDSLMNAAILEYRAADGTIVNQYPTRTQIQAFRRAEQLAESHTGNAQPEHLASPAPSGGGQASSAPSSSAASPAAPSTSDIVAAAASYSPPAAPGGNSTQSVTA